MSIELIFYVIDMLLSLKSVCFTIIGISAFSLIIGSMALSNEDESLKEYLSFFKKLIPYYILIIALLVLIPSQRTMYLMLGANYLKNSTLPSKVELAIEKKIDEYLKEDKK